MPLTNVTNLINCEIWNHSNEGSVDHMGSLQFGYSGQYFDLFLSGRATDKTLLSRADSHGAFNGSLNESFASTCDMLTHVT